MRRRSIPLAATLVALTIGLAAGCGGSGLVSSAATQGTFTQVGSLATGRVHHTATPIGSSGLVLVVGGKGRSGSTDVVLDSAEIFDPSTGRFTPATGRLAGARTTGQNGRMSHAAIALPTGKVLVIGGQTDVAGLASLDSCERFDPVTERFEGVLGSLSEPKSESLAISYVAGGVTFVLIAGGRRPSDALSMSAVPLSLRSADLYREDDDRVEPAPSGAQLITGRFGAKAVPLDSGEFVVQGGIERATEKGDPTPAGFEIFGFDPKTGEGRFTPSNQGVPTSMNHSLNVDRSEADAAILGKAVAIFGGSGSATAPDALDTIELYDDATNSWATVKARLQTPRQGHTATRLANGDVLVIGGRSAASPAISSTEIVSGSGLDATVSPGPPLRTARHHHTATLLANGQILVAGGEDAAGVPLASAEIFALPGSIVPGVGGAIVLHGGPGAPWGLSLAPTSGPVGTVVRITAASRNFRSDPKRNIVRFGGVVSPVESATVKELTVVVPNGATTGEVSVQVESSVSTPNPTFTVTGGP